MVFLKLKPSPIWNNSFAIDMSHLQNENENSQYVLNPYVVGSYWSSYMTKVEKIDDNYLEKDTTKT